MEHGHEGQKELRRGLKNRHIQMIALGGAIGTGLFYGSAASISLAGPSVLPAYLLGGTVIWLILRMMGEMAVAEPVAGASAISPMPTGVNSPAFSRAGTTGSST